MPNYSLTPWMFEVLGIVKEHAEKITEIYDDDTYWQPEEFLYKFYLNIAVYCEMTNGESYYPKLSK